jgi:hypothetical protein
MSDRPLTPARLLTVDEVRQRLPFKIARRTLAARIRASGLAIEHRRQLALDETSWTAFLETLKSPDQRAAEATERALALIAGKMKKPERISKLPKVTREDGDLTIYFVRTANRIKIGSAKDAQKRIQQLSTGNAGKLKLIGTLKGDAALEEEMHRRWAHLHIRGEWFRASRDLMFFIKTECQS